MCITILMQLQHEGCVNIVWMLTNITVSFSLRRIMKQNPVKKRSPVLRRKFLVIFFLSKKWELNHPLKTFFFKITNKKNQNFEKIKLRIFVTQSLGICHGNVGYAVLYALQTSCFWLTS